MLVSDDRKTLEDLVRVRAADLFAAGKPRTPYLRVVDNDDEGRDEMTVKVTRDNLVCKFERYESGTVVRQSTTRVVIDWVALHHGGERPRLWCTEPDCGRGGWILYLDFGHLVCRHCVDLPYASEKTPRSMRQRERALSLRRRLGGEPDFGAHLPKRPKGMHRATYARIAGDILRLERDFVWQVFERDSRSRQDSDSASYFEAIRAREARWVSLPSGAAAQLARDAQWPTWSGQLFGEDFESDTETRRAIGLELARTRLDAGLSIRNPFDDLPSEQGLSLREHALKALDTLVERRRRMGG